MTPEQFYYWVRGFAELAGHHGPNPGQWATIMQTIMEVKPEKKGGCSGCADKAPAPASAFFGNRQG